MLGDWLSYVAVSLLALSSDQGALALARELHDDVRGWLSRAGYVEATA